MNSALLLELFKSFLTIGAFSFGGGYASIPLIQQQVVENHQWLSLSQFTDLITISQMTPGPLAINAATFVGIRVAGIPGAIVATVANELPSAIIIAILAWVYVRYKDLKFMKTILSYLRPAVTALIASAGVSILITALFGEEAIITIQNLKINLLVIFLFCLFLLRRYKLNPILAMLIGGGMNLVWYLITGLGV